MPEISIRFYEELNCFLPKGWKKETVTIPFREKTPVKALIEECGVPHTEVDLILANGESVPFDYRLQPGDRISVYPVFEALDISQLSKVRPTPLRSVRFVLDVHLGKLAMLLRMLGFDTQYSNDFADEQICTIANRDHRIILTRDRGLLKRRSVTHGCHIRAQNPRQQLMEVVRRLDLTGCCSPFTRCLRCNTPLVDVPEKVGKNHRYRTCSACGRLYWRGSHWRNMQSLVRKVVSP